MDAFRIYVDFDDVVAETARGLTGLLHQLHGRRVPYEAILQFDLRHSFRLEEADYREFMDRAHEPGILLDLEETPGACPTLRAWLDDGLRPVVVTGRPPCCHAVTRGWLDARGLPDLPVLHVDKYHRPFAAEEMRDEVPMLAMADLQPMGFALAVDDAPVALDLLASHRICPGVLFERPWNRRYEGGDGLAGRVGDWAALDALVRCAAAQGAGGSDAATAD